MKYPYSLSLVKSHVLKKLKKWKKWRGLWDMQRNKPVACDIHWFELTERNTYVFKFQVAPEIVENPKDVTIVEGKDVVFSCTVDGNPSPRVTWTKNEEKLNTTTNLQLTASSLNNNNSLTIRDVHRSDSGQYRCVIINSVGNITSSPRDLNVQCK